MSQHLVHSLHNKGVVNFEVAPGVHDVAGGEGRVGSLGVGLDEEVARQGVARRQRDLTVGVPVRPVAHQQLHIDLLQERHGVWRQVRRHRVQHSGVRVHHSNPEVVTITPGQTKSKIQTNHLTSCRGILI
jgi:hypothetical protein